MPDTGALLQELTGELQRLRAACLAEDWDGAVRLLQVHDGHVRAAAAGAPAALLQEVLAAQRALLEEMKQWKETAARCLAECRQAQQALRAYQEEQP